MVNRLVALDKCQGVRPIGICQALLHVLGKVVALATRAYLKEVNMNNIVIKMMVIYDMEFSYIVD